MLEDLGVLNQHKKKYTPQQTFFYSLIKGQKYFECAVKIKFNRIDKVLHKNCGLWISMICVAEFQSEAKWTSEVIFKK